MRKRFALLGSPVSHSKSPSMHRAAFTAMGLSHTYEALLVPSAELAQRVQELRDGLWDGFNVTIPHKRAVLSLADSVDPLAAAVGAANTLVRMPDGTLRAYNTDVPALGDELVDLAGQVPAGGGTALVLGSGGAARCAVAACAVYMHIPVVRVRARTFANAPEQARMFGSEMTQALQAMGVQAQVTAEGLIPGSCENETACIVQATSAGMLGAESGEVIAAAVAWDALSPRAVALDVIYNPPRTPFLAAAETAGLRSKNGLGMLARQGALALEHWLGRQPPFNALLAALT